MTEKQDKTIALDNGLTLEIHDQSRLVAGDRWLVRLEARIDVPIELKQIESIAEKDKIIATLKKAFGESIPYRYAVEKNFVDHDLKHEVFQRFLETLEQNTFSYLSHPDFRKRLTMSKYRELKVKSPQLFQ